MSLSVLSNFFADLPSGAAPKYLICLLRWRYFHASSGANFGTKLESANPSFQTKQGMT